MLFQEAPLSNNLKRTISSNCITWVLFENGIIRACLSKDSRALLCGPQGSFNSEVTRSWGSFCFARSHLEVLSKIQEDRNNRKARGKWKKEFANTPNTKDRGRVKMLKDDETTAYQLRKILLEKGINVSQRSILRWWKRLGWTFRCSAYCQVIRQKNKEKRLQWAQECLNESEDGFGNVIWSDESSIQCETHKRYCYRKKNCPPKRKPRYISILH